MNCLVIDAMSYTVRHEAGDPCLAVGQPEALAVHDRAVPGSDQRAARPFRQRAVEVARDTRGDQVGPSRLEVVPVGVLARSESSCHQKDTQAMQDKAVHTPLTPRR